MYKIEPTYFHKGQNIFTVGMKWSLRRFQRQYVFNIILCGDNAIGVYQIHNDRKVRRQILADNDNQQCRWYRFKATNSELSEIKCAILLK